MARSVGLPAVRLHGAVHAQEHLGRLVQHGVGGLALGPLPVPAPRVLPLVQQPPAQAAPIGVPVAPVGREAPRAVARGHDAVRAGAFEADGQRLVTQADGERRVTGRPIHVDRRQGFRRGKHGTGGRGRRRRRAAGRRSGARGGCGGAIVRAMCASLNHRRTPGVEGAVAFALRASTRQAAVSAKAGGQGPEAGGRRPEAGDRRSMTVTRASER